MTVTNRPVTNMSAQTLDFAMLFDGRRDVWGTDAGPVERGELTLTQYVNHLNGREGIGIFPMRDDNTVRFGAIDLDEPNFELARTMQKLIPGESFIERSRSGNAHVWVFFKAPAPAWAVRTVLRGATESVGRPDVEIFPKQDGLRKDGVGNYINLPYYGNTRYVTLSDGRELWDDQPLESFLQMAKANLQNPEEWVKRARFLGGKPPEEREDPSEWGTSPVLHICAKHIVQNRDENPVTPGHRHQVLFHLSCQLLNYRDFSEAEAWDWVRAVNDASTKPLGQTELERLFANAVQGRFTFTGCDDPVMAPYVHPDCPIAHG